MKAREFFQQKKIIGMVHCLPLPGTLAYDGDMDRVYTQALADAQTLAQAGVGALIVENQNDVPMRATLSAEQFAALAAVASRVREHVTIPVGIDAAFCDWEAALAIAVAVQADFIRCAVFVDTVMTAAGEIAPCCADVVRYRKQLAAGGILLFCDVQVKHSYMVVDSIPITASAKMAAENGADAIIVTGTTTGEAAPIDIIRQVRDTVNLPILVGSGFSEANAHQQLAYIDGAIVGSSLKEGGVLTNPVDLARTKQLMQRVNDFSKT